MAGIFQALMIVTAFRWCAGNSVAIRNETSRCGNWKSYNDEKCFNTMVKFSVQSYEDASVICKAVSDELQLESDVRVVTIKTKEEQAFLQTYLFEENDNVDNVWLGIREKNNETGELEWIDGCRVLYTNWANDTRRDENHQCVQMTAGRDRDPRGTWTWANCRKRNDVVCEIPLLITTTALVKWFSSNKLELERLLDAAELKIDVLEKNQAEIIKEQKMYVALLNDIQKKLEKLMNDKKKEM